eukprot:2529766-Prymnesium_polylepis.1
MVAADTTVRAAHSRQTASRHRILDANALSSRWLEAGDTSVARRRDRCRGADWPSARCRSDFALQRQ